MRKIFLALLLFCGMATAQVVVGNYGVSYVNSAPSGSCSQSAPLNVVVGVGTLYSCQSGTWAQVAGGGGGSPGGASTTLQFNNSGAFGGVSQFTSNGTTTITGSATSIFDLHLTTTAGLLLPGALSTGLVKVTTGTGAVSTAAVGDVTGLFSSCSGTQYLGFDGNCHTATGIPSGPNTLQWDNAGVFGGVTQWTTNGTTTLTGSSTSILSVDSELDALFGPGINNTCYVDGIINTTINACATYFKNNSLAGGIIYSNTPEVFATNPFFPGGTQVAFTLVLGNGLSGVCDNSGSHNTCWRTSVPIIVPSGGDIQGQGAKVISISDNSNGTGMTFTGSFPAAIGPPAAAPTLTCANSGGSIVGTPTVFVETEYVNNLQGSNGLLLPGLTNPSAEASCTIPAGGTGTNGSVTVTSPAGTPGTSPFQAQDFEICAANATGQEVCGRNSTDPSGSNPATLTCGANGNGAVDTNACLLGSTATLTGLPIGTSNTFMPMPIDLTNPMVVMGQGNVSQTTYGSLLSRFSVNCNSTSHTSASDQLTNFPLDNEPNVGVWYRNGQEASKIDMIGVGGPCGGYANSPGAYIVVSEPDGGIQGFNPGAGPCSQSHAASGATNCNTGNVNTTFYDAIFAPQTAQVLTIQVLQSSFNQRTSGQTNTGASVWVYGNQTNVTATGDHVENFLGGDGWRVDHGANLAIVGGQGVCTSATKGCYHLTSTGGALSAWGVTNTNPVLKPTILDDINTITVTASGVGVPVNYSSLSIQSQNAIVNGVVSAPLLATNSSGQIIAATVPVNATNGGSGLAGPTAHSLLVGEGSLHFNLVTSPTSNGYCLVGFNVTAGVAVDPLCTLPGVPVDATNPATLLFSDRATYINWTSGSGLNLPAVAGAQFQNNLPFVLQNTAGTTLTITPNAGASDLIDGAASATLINKFASFVYQDGTTAPGHWFTLKLPTFAAFGATANGLSWSTTAGFAAQNADNLSQPRLCEAASASGTAYTCSTSPSYTVLDGDEILFEADVANTSSATLAVNGGTAATIKKVGGGTNLVANDILANQWTILLFDGTNWQDLGPLGNAPAGSGLSGMTSGQVAIAGSATTITSSKALAGSGSGVTTGPTSVTAGDVADFTGTGGQIADANVVAANLVVASSPGAGLAHFAGSTQTVTSSAVALSDMATQAAGSTVMNNTTGSAAPTAVVTGCTSGCTFEITAENASATTGQGGAVFTANHPAVVRFWNPTYKTLGTSGYINVTTLHAASHIDVGVYELTGSACTGGINCLLLRWHTGSLSGAATGQVGATGLTAFNMLAGKNYYLAACSDDTTVVISNMVSPGGTAAGLLGGTGSPANTYGVDSAAGDVCTAGVLPTNAVSTNVTNATSGVNTPLVLVVN